MKLTSEKVVISGADLARAGKVPKRATLAKSGFAEAEIANYSVKLEVAPLRMGHEYSQDTKTLDAFLDEYQALCERYGVKFVRPVT